MTAQLFLLKYRLIADAGITGLFENKKSINGEKTTLTGPLAAVYINTGGFNR